MQWTKPEHNFLIPPTGCESESADLSAKEALHSEFYAPTVRWSPFIGLTKENGSPFSERTLLDPQLGA